MSTVLEGQRLLDDWVIYFLDKHVLQSIHPPVRGYTVRSSVFSQKFGWSSFLKLRKSPDREVPLANSVPAFWFLPTAASAGKGSILSYSKAIQRWGSDQCAIFRRQCRGPARGP
ncbi:GQ67_00344T0 [Komagataella phaffii]|nr:GQ67_00344T0 [Komagataella phaffii]AOA67848.1 GQ68_01045T0 [Komagataella phaffii GS115]CAH2448572.1 Predicted protein [Komagataella phaffii CBS 7435]